MAKTELFVRKQSGGMFTVVNESKITGDIFWVDSGSATGKDAAGYGQNPDAPFLTLDYAIGQCTENNGDHIFVMPGHAEALAAVVTCDKAGVTIIGLGEGLARPQFTVADAIDGFTVTADDVVLENVYFNEASAAATSNINVAAARFVMRRVHMDQGANDVDAITVTAAGELPTFEKCTATVTANGPDSWIKFEGVIDRPIVKKCTIIGSDGTDAYDDGVLDFNNQAVTNPVVTDNTFDGADVATTVLANVGALVGDCFSGNRYAGLATAADTVSTFTATIGAGDITAASFGAGAIDAAAIKDGAIDAATLAADTITNAKIADDAIAAENLATGAIGADAIASDTILGANNANNAFDSSTVAYNGDGSLVERLELIQVSTERCIEKSDGSVPLGDDNLFTVAGGPILVTAFIGVVTTEIGADATTCTIQEAVTAPAGDVALSTAVNIEGDAVGTTYHFTAATPGVLTPVTAGAFDQLAHNFWLCPAGTIQATFSAATTGVIKWYMTYKPLSPNCVVLPAA